MMVGGVARRGRVHLDEGGGAEFGIWGWMDWVFGTGERAGEEGGEEGEECEWSEVDVREIAERILMERRERKKSRARDDGGRKGRLRRRNV